ncbi:MAG: VCBS repeat-containing protein [Bacteroidota bacterium]|nr:VCBS repeat-containing protein [Bacteroidota bacterium]
MGCSKNEPQRELLFQFLSSDETQIDFINKLDQKQLNIIEYVYYYNGGGVAVGDINNDGLVDIFFTSNENENKLYLNLGNFKFKDITVGAIGASQGYWSTGVTMADVNNDGYLDIYISVVGDYKGLVGSNQLFINNGDLTFTESAKEYGLDFTGFSTQAVFFDYDRDGDLDMYLLNHSVHSVRSYGPSSLRRDNDLKSGDILYKNNLKEGLIGFTDVTAEAGIFNSQIGYGLGVAVADINGDQWPDIYVSNDFHENDYLYINNGDGTFLEQLEARIGHTSRYSMGNAIGDINGDNLPDIITLDMLPEDPEILQKSAGEDRQEVSDIKKQFGYGPQYVRNTYQLNRGNGMFSDIAQLAGIAATDWSWSPLIADLDNDGHNDIFITNGIYKRPNDLDYIQYIGNLSLFKYSASSVDCLSIKMMEKMPTLKVSNYTYRNLGNHNFDNVSESWGLAEPSYSNGAVAADLNNDGKLDLIINNINQEAFIYKNIGNNTDIRNFIQVALKAGLSNHFGIGAIVNVFFEGQKKSQEIGTTKGFQSSSAPIAHFGLGKQILIDSIVINWPSGIHQTIFGPAINQKLYIHELALEKNMASAKPELIDHENDEVKLIPSYKHIENLEYKDNSNEYLIPYKLSTEGPALTIGDVNGDGLEDFFVGGSRNQPGSIYLQQPDGSFKHKQQIWESDHAIYEDVSAVFFDADGDQYLDLFIISGGNEDTIGSPLLQDRIYFNDGDGNFTHSKEVLPHGNHNGSIVKAADFDADGDIDLFIGSRSVPGNYGIASQQFILVNDGSGRFNLGYQNAIGMVTDAAWFDFDSDGDLDLILVGDWMPITLIENKKSKFEISKSDNGLQNSYGWWRSLKIADVDGDGIPDIIAGNVGENNKLSPSKNNPVKLYINDFDKNGKTDPVIFYNSSGRSIPLASKDLLAKQMPFINKKFNSYQQFARIESPTDIFEVDLLNRSLQLNANTFKTSIFLNSPSGKFRNLDIPKEVQFSTVNDILIQDFNNDNMVDILMVGNFFGNSVDIGRNDAQGQILLFKGKTGFHIEEVNTRVSSEYRAVKSIKIKGIDYLMLVRNNDSIEFVMLNKFSLN